MNFNAIKTAVAAQFDRIQKYPMFRVDVDKDELWATYIGSFPPGTNPMYRERTEHDCSCCRAFVRAIGDVVAVIDGRLVSIWSTSLIDDEIRVHSGPIAYDLVCGAMAQLCLSKPITGPFLHPEPSAGTDRNFEQLTGIDPLSESTGTVKTWTHFFVNIDRRFVKPKDAIPAIVGDARATRDVFMRSLREITIEAVDIVLDLITQGSLYRGEEHQPAVLQFKALKQQFDALPNERAREIASWTTNAHGAVARIRNTAIGTLLVDLSEGGDLEEAVRSFEQKVAPTNYKRPSALVTAAMIAKAKEKIEELGLTSALERRYARMSDISVNNLLFVDRAPSKAASDSTDVFDELVGNVRVNPKRLERVEEVSIDQFIADILPRAESIDVMLENRHYGNLVSLIAPVDPTTRRLFKWNNNFSWSYAGELADSIKERVKRAGGNVTGDLCCRLSWFNYDDLDLHLVEPDGWHIFFASKRSNTGGCLDVDMNAGCGTTREPVENIYYDSRVNMREGTYTLSVNQFTPREHDNAGFECEIDYLGTVYRFAYDRPMRHRETAVVAKFKYTRSGGLEILESLPATETTKTAWGLQTQTFHRAKAVMMSPNHWDGNSVGNKHYFFVLEGCQNDGTARGFFNEFLDNSLDPHRKVFEMVGAKMKPADSTDQLSGLGFSSTQRNTLVCRVRGSFTRTIKVTF